MSDRDWCSEFSSHFQLTCFPLPFFPHDGAKATETRRKTFSSWCAKARAAKNWKQDPSLPLAVTCDDTSHHVYCFSFFYALEFSASVFRTAGTEKMTNKFSRKLLVDSLEWSYLWKQQCFKRHQPQHPSNVSFADFQFVASHLGTAESPLQQWKRVSNKWKSKRIRLVAAWPEQRTLRKCSREETWVWHAALCFPLVLTCFPAWTL